MIKRYKEFVKDIVNEEVELDSMENDMSFVEEPNVTDESELEVEPITDESELEVEESPVNDLPEEEGGEYQGQILLNQLASELGTEVSEDGSINYEGKKINFFSETEKFHVDNKKFSTIEEVINYLGKSESTPSEGVDTELVGSEDIESENSIIEEDDIEEDFEKEDEEDAFESKSYRHTRLKKFGI